MSTLLSVCTSSFIFCALVEKKDTIFSDVWKKVPLRHVDLKIETKNQVPFAYPAVCEI